MEKAPSWGTRHEIAWEEQVAVRIMIVCWNNNSNNESELEGIIEWQMSFAQEGRKSTFHFQLHKAIYKRCSFGADLKHSIPEPRALCRTAVQPLLAVPIHDPTAPRHKSTLYHPIAAGVTEQKRRWGSWSGSHLVGTPMGRSCLGVLMLSKDPSFHLQIAYTALSMWPDSSHI